MKSSVLSVGLPVWGWVGLQARVRPETQILAKSIVVEVHWGKKGINDKKSNNEFRTYDSISRIASRLSEEIDSAIDP